ncbi:hypothetical protein [Pedobacter jeongneungensis]|uniref:hypothetical protein n=1 Tax=Pedobacter jeongneungensis TaxID=947309 RepID=UPI00046A3AC6|nr:hypothetical protein [Pedobacter jeongneungensis]
MITTTFLLLLISFELWYLTSKQFKEHKLPDYLVKIIANAKLYRIVAAILFIVACYLFIFFLGVTSGLTAIVFATMAAGSLVVVIQPFQYLRITTVAMLYFTILLLEFFI